MSEGDFNAGSSQNPDINITNPFAEKSGGGESEKPDDSRLVDVGDQVGVSLGSAHQDPEDPNRREEIFKYTEERGLKKLVERYSEKIGGYKIHPVGESGFLLQSEKQLPMAGNDWFLFDYDDTLRGTTEVKSKRLELYVGYARSLGIEASEEELKHLVDITDKFARWEDVDGGGNAYHANTHMSVLHWATEKMRSSDEDSQERVINEIDTTLARIKGELTVEGESHDGDPFHFRDNRFILKTNFWFQDGALTPWSDGIKDIFMQSMINPPDYPASIQAMKEIGHPSDSIHRVNIGVFTYGQPYYQLLKVFELLEQNPDTPISQIWLTKVPKGEFIRDLVKTQVTRKLPQDYVPPIVGGDSLDEGMSMGSGYPLGDHPHVLVMMDDNPKELNSILETNEFLSQETGATFAVVRSRGGGGRETDKEWIVDTPNGEIDFRNKEFTAKEVALTLESCRYMNYVKKYGPESPKVIDMRQRLEKLGSDDQLSIAD